MDPEYDHVYGNNAVSVWTVRGASEMYGPS